MITPILRLSNESESKYNDAHAKGRCVVERTFGLLKSRFRCLHKSGGRLMFEPFKCAQIISACLRLHNMCINNNVPLMVPFVNDIGEDHPEAQQSALAKRQAIVR